MSINSRLLRALFPTLLASVVTGVCHAQPVRSTLTLKWDSATEFDTCYRDRYLDSLSTPGAVKLVNRVLVVDEMGAGYNNFQPIKGKTQARKILMVDNPGVTDAWLMVDGSAKACDIVVNGTVLQSTPVAKTYWEANFERYAVPPQLLKAGANDIVFRARGTGSGSIRLERSMGPNRSAVSRDGGASWDFDRLGEGGYMNGELGVRLNLGRFAPTATITSPVFDLAGAARDGSINAGIKGRIDALDVDASIPAGTTIQAFYRTGATPDGYEENWDAWQPWPPRSTPGTLGRFAQWRLQLNTTSPAKTPVVNAVTVRFSAEKPTATNATQINVVEDANQKIVRSSYEYTYANYTGNSRILRDRWKLGEVVASGKTDFEKLSALRQWTRNQWTNGWNKGELHYIPSWDARIILTLAPQNLSLGMCTHYATTFVQCAQALGLPARSIFHGHALSEAWSNEHQKWMIMDAGYDPNDKRRATYHIERNGVPLSNLEVQKAVFVNRNTDGIRVVATNMSASSAKPEPALAGTKEELEKFLRDGEIEGRRQMFIELRNDFVDHREPEEPEHGEGYFKYLGHLYWKDGQTPNIHWTDFFTMREADLYWTLNQAQMHLWRAPGTNTVQVLLDTVTPGFSGYEVRTNDGEWQSWTPKAGSTLANAKAHPMKPTGGSIEFDWNLQAGRNTIEVRPFNAAGLRGIISRMVLDAK